MPAPHAQRGVPAATTFPQRLLVSLLAVGAVAAPYALRALDDDRLTSWSWVFAARNPAALFALALAAALLAHPAARLAPARRREAVLFLGAYAIGACFWSEPEPIVDAARYFTQAKHLELYGLGHFLREWGREIPAWTDLPLVPLLYGTVLRLSGESRLAVEAFTTLLFAGSTVFTARIGRALWDEETGLAAGVLLLAIPYLFTQVPLLLVDVPTLFFLALAVYASLRAFQDGGAARVVLAGVAVFLALFSKYSAGLFLSVLPVAAVVLARSARRGLAEGGEVRGDPASASPSTPRRPWRRQPEDERAPSGTHDEGSRPLPPEGSAESVGARRPLVALAGIALVSGVLSLAAVLPHREVFARQLALLLGYQAPGLRRWGESFLSTFLFQVHPFVTAAAVASAWVAFRRRDARWLVAAWPVLLLVALGVRRIRYLLPAFPMLALLAAYGLHALRTRELRRIVVACAVLSSLAVGLYGYLPFLRGTSAMNLKRAGAYLDGLDVDRVEVMTASGDAPEVNPAVAVPILDLLTAKRLVYRDEGIPRPTGERAETSALRFTWELGIPRWYAPEPGEGKAAVAVLWDGAAPLPARVEDRIAGYVLGRAFDAGAGVFRYTTRVRVYVRPPAGRAPAPAPFELRARGSRQGP